MTFTCKLCGAEHEASEVDAATGVTRLPSGITTRRNDKLEWMFVCTEQESCQRRRGLR
jgi:hypothetical protein